MPGNLERFQRQCNEVGEGRLPSRVSLWTNIRPAMWGPWKPLQRPLFWLLNQLRQIVHVFLRDKITLGQEALDQPGAEPLDIPLATIQL